MIDFLKTYLSAGFLKGASAKDIEFIKTQNGLAHPNKKLVFYVFKGQAPQPALVIYASRHQRANNILEQSIKNLESNQDFAPKILFKDYYHDILFVGLEYVVGRSLQLGKDSDLDLAFNWLAKRYQSSSGNATNNFFGFYKDIEEKFKDINLPLDFVDSAIIKQVGDINLPIIRQHGDWQDNNIFVGDDRLKIIDWDDYGFINWPLFDFTTLYFKCLRKKVDTRYLKNKKKEFFENIALPEINDDVLKIFYELFNFLRKDRLHNKYERARHYRDLLIYIKK